MDFFFKIRDFVQKLWVFKVQFVDHQWSLRIIGNIVFHVKGMSGKKTSAKYKQQPKIRIIIKRMSYFYKDVNKK